MRGTNIWVTSDTHFGHAKIIDFCERPFSTPQEMDEVLIERWNSVVGKDDVVWHCGDVVWKWNVENNQLDRLNGNKRLILGNHDDAKDNKLTRYFQKVVMWVEWPELDMIMSHAPIHDDALLHRGGSYAINVHGHIHDRLIPDPRYVNVCVEHTDYTPVHIDVLVAQAKELRQ